MKKNRYQICTKTVMDTSDPNIQFDKNGISNHYWDFEKNVKKHWHPNEIGYKELLKIIDKIKEEGKNKEFDCIIGLSGGIDSSYMLHKSITEFGLRPLVFHVDGGWNSEVATNNINQLVNKLSVELYTEVIDWEDMRNFQLAMFKSGVPHLDIPQDMAFIAVLYKFAEKHNIKYILNGGNISTECVLMPLDILYWTTDLIHINDILRKNGNPKISNYPFINILYHKLYLRYIKKIKVIKPLNYLSYKKNEASKELEDTYGWRPYPRKHFESRFTQFFEGYWLPSRFNYDMRRNQLSSLILTNQMTREEAIKILENPPYEIDQIDKDKKYISSKLEITVEELMQYHKLPLKYYWNYKNQKILFDIGQKVLNVLTSARRGGSF